MLATLPDLLHIVDGKPWLAHECKSKEISDMLSLDKDIRHDWASILKNSPVSSYRYVTI